MTNSTDTTAPISRHPADSGVWSDYDIEVKTSLTGRALRNLKHGDAFAVLDSLGDVGTVEDTAEGLFYRDTRFLSHFELHLEGKRPLILRSDVHEDKAALSVDCTNPDLFIGQNDKLLSNTIFMQRTKFLWNATCYERVSIKNFTSTRVQLHVDFLFDADFHDLFEVRGTPRENRGTKNVRVIGPNRVVFHYDGLDKIERETAIIFFPDPRSLDSNRASFEVTLDQNEQTSLFVSVACDENGVSTKTDFLSAYRGIRRARRTATSDIATVDSPNDLFNAILCRATSDVYTLITWSDLGPYPYAGVPWFSTIFGRDGIITAMFMIWLDPSIARGVLRTLASTQARTFDPKSDAQPGKILHELRHGEMANLGEVPFGRYYGSIDATPLFIMLAGMYFDRTGDRETILDIWPNIESALRWIDRYGDRDGDGFIEYYSECEVGLANQGWKDSYDAIFHADGAEAEGPIALCEVQGYVYAAKQHAARMASRLGIENVASRLSEQAEQLRVEFERKFWCEDIGTYALALDGAKRQCCVRASNAGQVLFTGIAAPERARRVAERLLTPDGFSGWGIRTLSRGEARFNPMSYHNGSVWPHDNALIAMGFARYGLKQQAARVFQCMLDAAGHQELRRLPELFCGFVRRPHSGPTPYPVACSPQAWAAAAFFGLLGACLGLEADSEDDVIRLCDPVMPPFIDELAVRNLRLGASYVDLRLHRYGTDVTANVLSRRGTAKVLVLK